MKVTQEQLIQLAKAAGLSDVEVVEDSATADFDLNVALGSIDENRGKILRPKIEEELTPELTRAIDGRRGGTIRNFLIKHSGISRATIDKIEKDEEAIQAALKHYGDKLAGDNVDVKKQIDELIAAHNSEKESLTSEWTNKLEAEKSIRVNRDKQEWLLSNVMKDAPLLPNADRNILSKDLQRHLDENYSSVYDESAKALELYSKENAKLPAMNGQQRLTPAEVAKEFFSARGLWQTNTSNINPKEAMANVPTTAYQQPNPLPKGKNINADPAAHALAQRQEFYKANGLG